MAEDARRYYFGSYGLVRGYGPLYRTIEEADRSVFRDAEEPRENGGGTDRNAVAVSILDGGCWWVDDGEDIRENEMIPVRTSSGEQARYSMALIGAMKRKLLRLAR